MYLAHDAASGRLLERNSQPCALIAPISVGVNFWQRGASRRSAGCFFPAFAAATRRSCIRVRLNRRVDPHHKAVVGIARGSSMEDAVRHAVTLAGGLNFIKPEQTVLIKPNVTGAAKFPTTTNPEVLYAVIKLVAERGPRRIYVSDRCFSPAFTEVAPKTIQVMKYVGHLDAVEAAKKDFKAPVVAVGLEAAAQELEYLGRPAKTPLWRRDQAGQRHALARRVRAGRAAVRRRSRD